LVVLVWCVKELCRQKYDYSCKLKGPFLEAEINAVSPKDERKQ
jgi:hypothetical protein